MGEFSTNIDPIEHRSKMVNFTMSGLTSQLPAVAMHLTWPPSSLFKLPPDNEPQALPAPQVERSILKPFNISPELFQQALEFKVPVTVALLYAVTAISLNRVNARRQNKPWAISKTRAFYYFVLVHNMALAIYSAWTWAGMGIAFARAWPGFNNEYGLVGVTDALCKYNGPRGLGNAATYDAKTQSWNIANRSLLLGSDARPDPTDVGRLWNEGLAFYGWLFYLSKFYEVLDTAIILAKGKKSSTLQTYHHAGAMMCMWAGIRFMAPAIWMFVQFNSGIHALMVSQQGLWKRGMS